MKLDLKSRIKKELNELNGRLTKLQNFIKDDKFQKLNKTNQNLLLEQQKVMQKYADILIKRIEIN